LALKIYNYLKNPIGPFEEQSRRSYENWTFSYRRVKYIYIYIISHLPCKTQMQMIHLSSVWHCSSSYFSKCFRLEIY